MGDKAVIVVISEALNRAVCEAVGVGRSVERGSDKLDDAKKIRRLL
jgi:hypothetical protein